MCLPALHPAGGDLVRLLNVITLAAADDRAPSLGLRKRVGCSSATGGLAAEVLLMLLMPG